VGSPPRTTKPATFDLLGKDLTEQSLIAVLICLPGPEQSSNPVRIGLLRLMLAGSETRHHRQSEIGLCLTEPYRNRGYESEAIRWILGWGFKTAGLHRIGLWAYAYNEGVLRLYERLGIVREGVIRESHLYEGMW
jgi:RimJ/RimL family protein N-acetyltransferase